MEYFSAMKQTLLKKINKECKGTNLKITISSSKIKIFKNKKKNIWKFDQDEHFCQISSLYLKNCAYSALEKYIHIYTHMEE